jgi:signal recognition particle receptor subunit beta
MASGLSDQGAAAAVPPVTTKILVAGGFGVGKTTLVGTISEVRPLRTEEALTDTGTSVDDITAVLGVGDRDAVAGTLSFYAA